MGPIEFAEACREERDVMLAALREGSVQSAANAHLSAANLSSIQREHVMSAMDAALTDVIYTILLALDGSASLGGKQQVFVLRGERGETISDGNGQLEAAAWETFQASA